jgi:precorrin-3B synthase
MLAVRLGGDASVAGVCAPHEIADVATRVALAFLTSRGGGDDAPRRMRDLIARDGREAIIAAAVLDPPMEHDAPARTDLAAIIGARPLGATCFLGVAAPFGRLHADDLGALADVAARVGARELRLTPWRALLAVGLTRDGAAAMARALARSNLILNPGDPRRKIAACAGAPACNSASTRVHEDAAMLAPLLASLTGGVVLHISGCAKGCARRAATRFTLVGDDGLYNLVEDGRTRDESVLTGLTARDAYAVLSRRIAGAPA